MTAWPKVVEGTAVAGDALVVAGAAVLGAPAGRWLGSMDGVQGAQGKQGGRRLGQRPGE